MKIKIIFSSLLIVSLLLITSVNPVTSNSNNVIGVKKEVDMERIIDSKLDNNLKIEPGLNYVKFNSMLNTIKLIFKNNREILTRCHQATIILQILPDSVCHIIYWFIVNPIVSILLNVWYNHPDYLIQYYAYAVLELVIEIYSYFCDWIPSEHLAYGSLNETFGFLRNYKSSSITQCPCLQD